ncbi:alpha/beta hydrolase [Sphingomonas kaistensis]|uniref:Alpha/beta hydrolase n=1 Tax=Sphingomonas kaistensis TaxID=298708 RepID=A0ABZ2G5Q0_9SPHN
MPAGKGPFPVVAVIHGGCWTRSFEGVSGTAPLADMLTRRGIATWNIEYRAVGDAGGGYPGTFQDVGAGVDHLRSLAKRYPLDLKRSAFVGHSAGAHLALYAASRPRLAGPLGKNAITPISVAAIDGPGSVREFVGLDKEICGKPVIVPLLGGTPEQTPQAYRDASPIDHLPLGMRTLLVKGALGFGMEAYEAKAKAAGDDVRVITTNPKDHFDMITPGLPNAEKTADWLAANLFAPKVVSTKR